MCSDLDVDMKTIISQFREIIGRYKNKDTISGKDLFDDICKNEVVCNSIILSIIIKKNKTDADKMSKWEHLEFRLDENKKPKCTKNNTQETLECVNSLQWTKQDILELVNLATSNVNYSENQHSVIEGGSLSSKPLFDFKGCICLSMVYLRF